MHLIAYSHIKALQAPLKSLACFDGSISLKPGLFHLCGKMTSLRRSGEDGLFIIEGFHGYWSPLDYIETKTKISHQSQAKTTADMRTKRRGRSSGNGSSFLGASEAWNRKGNGRP